VRDCVPVRQDDLFREQPVSAYRARRRHPVRRAIGRRQAV